MTLLIKNITVVDIESPMHNKQGDIVIDNGVITQLDTKCDSNTSEVFDGSGLYVSGGWVDMHVNFCDPGNEHKEDLRSGCESALYGGITDVLLMPSTTPPLDNKAQVEYVLNQSRNEKINVHVAGAITARLEGKELAEMNDMMQAGALVFTDDKRGVQNLHLLQLASTYAKNIGTKLIHYCEEKSLVHTPGVNESAATTSLGFKGTASLSEVIGIQNALAVMHYTQSPLHITCISTHQGVNLIREAKQNNMPVTCDVAIHNLVVDDAHLKTYDSNFKTVPPLRTKKDIYALIGGLADGTIDAIVSDHTPQDIESKKVEFDFAAPGIIGTQTLFGLACTYLLEHMPLDKIIQAISYNPRKIIGLAPSTIIVGNPASLTIFNMDKEWIVTNKILKSKSHNTPFIGWRLKGKPVAVYTKNKLSLLQE